jgi:hypothetical protein
MVVWQNLDGICMGGLKGEDIKMRYYYSLELKNYIGYVILLKNKFPYINLRRCENGVF